MRLRRFKMRTMLLGITIISLALAILRPYFSDPSASRLKPGSVVLIDPDDPAPRASVAVYPKPLAGGRYIAVRARTRARVLDDSQPSRINTFIDDATRKTGDDRNVWIKVLDGKQAGLTGYTSRFYLRPGK
jgi:hypothetical protein